MKRGRKAAVSLEEQKTVLKEYKEKFLRNEIPPLSDPVYYEISEKLYQKMSAKSICVSIKRNYNFFFNEKERDSSVDKCSEKNLEIIDTCVREYNFYIDIYAWNKIKPINRYVKRTKSLSDFRRKTVLPSHEWATLLREEIWKNIRSPCSWVFKKYSINNEVRVKCSGACKQCNAEIEVVIHWPTEKVVHCVCIISNFNENINHKYTKKLKLSSSKRCELSEELKSENAVTVRNKIMDSLLDENCDFEPAHLPTMGCLRQIKYEQRKSAYYDPNPILALWMMTRLPPYNTLIKFISLFPVCIYYWSFLQEKYYREYGKNHKTVLSIDATGSMFKPCGPNKDLTLTRHMFLYSCVMLSDYSASVPMAHMISDSHTIDTIFKWLDAWYRHQNNIAPNEVVVDDCAALIGAAVKAFTPHKSTTDYVNACYDKLQTNEQTPQECFIRIDTSHFIKILINLKCFKHVDQRVKFFYVKCLQAIKLCEDYDSLKSIVIDVITMCLNKFDGLDSEGTLTRCEHAKIRLKRLSSFKNTSESEIKLENDTKILETLSTKESLFLDTELKNVISNDQLIGKNPKWYYNAIDAENLLLTLTDGDCESHDNLYYFPQFLKTLTRLMRQLPLWSNIMKRTFQSDISIPTSSNVEVYFKMLKSYLCHIHTKSERYRIDEFILKHEESISGQLKSACSELNKGNKQKIKREKKNVKNKDNTKTTYTKGINDESIFSDMPSMLENWRGLAVDKQEREKKMINKKITLLRNASLTTSPDNSTVFSNTCAFDSVAQAIAVAVTDEYAINMTINSNENDEYFQFIKMIIANKIPNAYKLRGEILKKHFDNKTIDGKLFVSCECNIAYIFENILLNKIYSADVHETCSNIKCPTNKVHRKCAFVPIDLSNDTFCESSVMITSGDLICRHSKCPGIRKVNYNLKDILFFEPDSEKKISIYALPKKINLKGIEYHLLSVIEFEPSLIPKGIGHYRAHCRRGQSKWQCYDDMCSETTASCHTLITAHCFIYAKKDK